MALHCNDDSKEARCSLRVAGFCVSGTLPILVSATIYAAPHKETVMGASYAREKLSNAVYTLATGTEVLQKRLVDAFISMSAVSDRDFEGERLTEWQSIYERATAVASGPYDGSYQNTLLTLNDDDAVQLARDICELEAMMGFEDE